MRKLLTATTISLALIASLLATTPASAEGIEAVDACPELTDSVDRLYSAYFLRAPDAAGIDYWLTEYSEGRWALARISQFFSSSDEFKALYGSLSNREFIELIYQNILGRAGEPSGVEFWTGRLDRGEQTRGEVMLSFSEGPEYISITGTAQPLAGYYQWYPEGTMWFCGTDNRDIPFSPGTSYYADGIAELGPEGGVSENFIVRSEDADRRLNSLLVNAIVEDNSYVVFWNGEYDIIPSWQDTVVLEVTGIDHNQTDFRWAVAVYPTSIGSARGGLGDLETRTVFGGSLVGCNGCN